MLNLTIIEFHCLLFYHFEQKNIFVSKNLIFILIRKTHPFIWNLISGFIDEVDVQA